ncbi:acetyl-CoA C-acetyltransferase [Gordonia humi]
MLGRMTEAVIVATARSPIGRAGKGSLASLRPDEMARQMIATALAKVPELDPSLVEDIHLGIGQPGGQGGYNIARSVAVQLGYDHIPGVTVNRYCSSSVQTTRMALHAIKAGEGDVFISGGVESVSSMGVSGGADGLPNSKNPLFDDAQARTAKAAEGGAGVWHDPREDGLIPDVYIAMGQTAENVASYTGISREDQDRWGVLSQNRAEKAITDGFFAREIDPLTLADGTVVSADDGPRAGTTYEKISQLKPVFRPDGTVTAGNACPLNDGAAALVVMSDTKAKELGLKPLARIVATAATGLSPEIMGLGPIEAVRKVLRVAGMSIGDIDLTEINEAFAVQVLGSAAELGIDHDKLNVSGGAIALGHPFGMTGARITTTLLNNLTTHDGQFGLETMCVGGGQGMAMILERL